MFWPLMNPNIRFTRFIIEFTILFCILYKDMKLKLFRFGVCVIWNDKRTQLTHKPHLRSNDFLWKVFRSYMDKKQDQTNTRVIICIEIFFQTIHLCYLLLLQLAPCGMSYIVRKLQKKLTHTKKMKCRVKKITRKKEWWPRYCWPCDYSILSTCSYQCIYAKGNFFNFLFPRICIGELRFFIKMQLNCFVHYIIVLDVPLDF